MPAAKIESREDLPSQKDVDITATPQTEASSCSRTIDHVRSDEVRIRVDPIVRLHALHCLPAMPFAKAIPTSLCSWPVHDIVVSSPTCSHHSTGSQEETALCTLV